MTHLFLDLDDTLYPPESGIWQAVGERITRFMTELVGISDSDAIRLRERYFHQHGTTLSGLIEHHGIDPHVYMAYVHDVPVQQMLDPDPELGRLLVRIPMKKVIFTNADRAHSKRVLSALGVNGAIDQVVDYFSVAPANKPEPSAYAKALELARCRRPEKAIMVDDQLRNLLPAGELGMRTVLVHEAAPSNGADVQVAEVKQFLAALAEEAASDA